MKREWVGSIYQEADNIAVTFTVEQEPGNTPVIKFGDGKAIRTLQIFDAIGMVRMLNLSIEKAQDMRAKIGGGNG